jgi:hypothetical protein
MSLFFIVALALSSVSAQDQSLEPVLGWQWDDNANRCELTQQDPNSRMELEVSQYPASDQIRVSIADIRLKIADYKSLSGVTLALKPGRSYVGAARLYPPTDKLAALVSVEVSDDQILEDFAKASTVVISSEKMTPIDRPVRAADAAAQALRHCADQRMSRWGIDPAYWHGLQKRPHPIKPLGSLLSQDDYPPGYALNGVSGGVLLRLTVDIDGRVKDCVSLNRRADRYVLQNVCGKMKLAARFEPALDENGRKVEAPFIMAESFSVVR